MKKTIFAMLLSACPAMLFAATEPVADECAKLAPDLKYMHEQLAANSANVNYSQENKDSEQKAFGAALKEAEHCKSGVDYLHTLRRYVATFHEHHMEIYTHIASVSTKSTGLLLAEYNGHYIIYAKAPGLTAPDSVHIGDELLSCDGRTPDKIMREDILPFAAYFDEAATIHKKANMVFLGVDVKEGDVTNCVFSRDGKTFAEALRWQEIKDFEKSLAPLEQDRPLYSLERIDGVPWIIFSHMDAHGKDQQALLDKFLSEAKSLRGDNRIVLDLRGNGGGNSAWGDQWIENLLGYLPQTHTKWMQWITEENNKWLIKILDDTLATGSLSAKERTEYLEYEQAVRQGKPGSFVDLSTIATGQPAPEKSLFSGKIITLTDYGCFSSCEDFVQRLRKSGVAVQVGIPTDASTIFNNVRNLDTPSGLANFSFMTGVEEDMDSKPGPLMPDIPLKYNIRQEVSGQDSLKLQVIQMLRDGKL